MYQGALTMFLSTLFWNRCIMSMLLCLVHPHVGYRMSKGTLHEDVYTFLIYLAQIFLH